MMQAIAPRWSIRGIPTCAAVGMARALKHASAQLPTGKDLVGAPVSTSHATMSGHADLQGRGGWDRVATSLSNGLFAAMHVGSGHSISSPVWVALVAVQYLQFLYFPIALMVGGGQLRAVLAQILKLTSLTRVDEELGGVGLLAAAVLVSGGGEGVACVSAFRFTSPRCKMQPFHRSSRSKAA